MNAFFFCPGDLLQRRGAWSGVTDLIPLVCSLVWLQSHAVFGSLVWLQSHAVFEVTLLLCCWVCIESNALWVIPNNAVNYLICYTFKNMDFTIQTSQDKMHIRLYQAYVCPHMRHFAITPCRCQNVHWYLYPMPILNFSRNRYFHRCRYPNFYIRFIGFDMYKCLISH